MADSPNDKRRRLPPQSPFEEQVGFTRALRVGDRIIVSGTTANGNPPPEDAGEQADLIFQQIRGYIEELGGKMEDVIRVRMFVTDNDYADAVSDAFTKHLSHVRPTGTLVAIDRLYRAEIKVEIEAEAVVGA